MQAQTPAVLLASLCLAFAGCRFEVHSSTTSTTVTAKLVQERTGPEFEVAFPDPSVLLTTDDIDATRKTLDTIPLPETDAHHDMLRKLLADAESVDSEHLTLLTEAVATNHRIAKDDQKKRKGGAVHITTIDGKRFVYSRMQGPYAPVIDELLLAGAKKLSDVGPRSFGRLIVLTQEAKTVIALSDLLLDKSDNGSAKALATILDEIKVASIRHELCVKVLLPRDRLNGPRADIAIESMSFDSNRANLIGAIYQTRDSIDGETLYRHAKLQSFDSGRTSVVKHGAPKLGAVSATTAKKVVALASFDSGRESILKLLKDKIRLQSAREAIEFMKLNSFDSGKKKALQCLLGGKSFPRVQADDLVAFAKLASFDSDRHKMLDLLAPHFDGRFTALTAKKLLKAFSFDSGRVKVVTTFADALQDLPKDARLSILDTFTFDSDRKRATKLIMK